MPVELFDFVTHIPRNGFRLVRARTSEGDGKELQLFLIPVIPADAEQQPFSVLDLDVVLFRVFAETQPTPEGILAFADKYGPLGIDVPIKPEQAVPSLGSSPKGEPMEEWRQHISTMSQLVGIWDLCRHRNSARLSRHYRWKQDGTEVVFTSHVGAEESSGPSELGHQKTRRVIALDEVEEDLLRRLEPKDVLRLALVDVQRCVDKLLRQHEHKAVAFMGFDKPTASPVVRFKASSLLSALWLQLADAIAYNRKYDQCEVCQKWFEVAPDAARSHRRFCSDACRVSAYRDRQEQARRLHFEEGKSFEEIAEELDSKADTVRRWITGR